MGMSIQMYEHISKNLDSVNVELNSGSLKTARGTSGTVCSSTGYVVFKLKGKKVGLHQVIAVMLYGSECIGMTVNHKDGNKLNNRSDNLELLSLEDNVKHAHANGLCTYLKGEDNATSVLSEIDVIDILRKLSCGISQRALAKEYGVAKGTIQNIKERKTWIHVNLDS